MHDRMKRAFGYVHAEQDLKDNTRRFLQEKARRRPRSALGTWVRLLPACACLLCLLFGGAWFYFTPAVAISIDINPSLELGVNRLEQVISVRGYNSDGQALADSLDIQYLNYTEAVRQILDSEVVQGLLADQEVLSIGVIGPDDEQTAQMLTELESCTEETENTYCYHATHEEVGHAHDLGLSYGKYQAYLDLQALDPSITLEEVQQMTMREIHEKLGQLCEEDDDEDTEEEHGHQGHGTDSGTGQGTGSGTQQGAGQGTGAQQETGWEAGNGAQQGTGQGAHHASEGESGQGRQGRTHD